MAAATGGCRSGCSRPAGRTASPVSANNLRPRPLARPAAVPDGSCLLLLAERPILSAIDIFPLLLLRSGEDDDDDEDDGEEDLFSSSHLINPMFE